MDSRRRPGDAGQPPDRMLHSEPDAPAQKPRIQREADALRENLLRRKQQLRARQGREQEIAKT